ncbi:hypothetical protein ACLMNJ_17250 [Streptomyces seoulensis]
MSGDTTGCLTGRTGPRGPRPAVRGFLEYGFLDYGFLVVRLPPGRSADRPGAW